MKVFISVANSQQIIMERFKNWARLRHWAAHADIRDADDLGSVPSNYERVGFTFSVGHLEALFYMDLPKSIPSIYSPYGDNVIVHATLYGKRNGKTITLHTFSQSILNPKGSCASRAGLEFIYSIVEAWFGPNTKVTASAYNFNEEFYSIVWPEKAKRRFEMFVSGKKCKRKKKKNLEGVELKILQPEIEMNPRFS